MITPVILSGGSGTRLWPLSRKMYPKQFLPLTSDRTMLQETVARLDGLETDTLQVICNEEHRFLVAEQLRQVNLKGDIILEPAGRNTAPAIALSALALVQANRADSVMLVLAADHVIEDNKAFQNAVNTALPLAEDGRLVTFGIVPTEPATGYGYINGAEISDQPYMSVSAFVEKPDLQTATAYIETGGYFWNSGMFMFRADRYLEELQKFRPDILAICEQSISSLTMDLDFMRIDAAVFSDCPEDSIDYAVMERTDSAVMVPMDAGWSDVGSWSALWDVNEKDDSGNVTHGDVILESTHDTYVYSEDRLVSALGVDNLVIVDTKDALLVADKKQVQNVKKIVSRVQGEGRTEHLQHREVYRPWGRFDSIANGSGYQVKRITVDPGEKLSLQKHLYRAEHWIVVRGMAQVRCGDKEMLLTANQSTYIPLGEVHQLHNPGEETLEIIEVQSGSYLGEDDIVRLADDYGRR